MIDKIILINIDLDQDQDQERKKELQIVKLNKDKEVLLDLILPLQNHHHPLQSLKKFNKNKNFKMIKINHLYLQNH